MILKLFKLLLGLVLLPVVAAVAMAVWELVRLTGEAGGGLSPLGRWWLLGGFAFWVLLFMVMPRPVRSYVLAHELTHALWAWAMGGRVSGLRVGKNSGHVRVSKTNVWITLAPYFFPLYTVLVLLAYGLLSMFRDLHTYEPFWLALVGLTWSFHLTFTVSLLREHQSDIEEGGRLFSYSVIYLLNLLGLCLWIVVVGTPTLEEGLVRWDQDLRSTWGGLAGAIPAAAGKLRGGLSLENRPETEETTGNKP